MKSLVIGVVSAQQQQPGFGFPNFGFGGFGQNGNGFGQNGNGFQFPGFGFPGQQQQPQQPQPQQPQQPGTFNAQPQSGPGAGQQQFNPFATFNPQNLFNQFTSGFGNPFGQQQPNVNIPPTNPNQQQPQPVPQPVPQPQPTTPIVSPNAGDNSGSFDPVTDARIQRLIKEIFTERPTNA